MFLVKNKSKIETFALKSTLRLFSAGAYKVVYLTAKRGREVKSYT